MRARKREPRGTVSLVLFAAVVGILFLAFQFGLAGFDVTAGKQAVPSDQPTQRSIRHCVDFDDGLNPRTASYAISSFTYNGLTTCFVVVDSGIAHTTPSRKGEGGSSGSTTTATLSSAGCIDETANYYQPPVQCSNQGIQHETLPIGHDIVTICLSASLVDIQIGPGSGLTSYSFDEDASRDWNKWYDLLNSITVSAAKCEPASDA
ncbi:MAG: hypothetical protein KKA90_00375 [Nanoarchaeota archaeon]|nr:hypothetical protein [Nanoarchaeota archaeon]